MLKLNEKYMYGVEEMDTEHAELISRAERLMEAYQKGEADSEIIKLLEYLAAYVVIHFRNEEKLLASYDYPLIDAHRTLHREFKNDVIALQNAIHAEGMTLQSRLKLTHLTTEWIDHHIGTEDKIIAEFIKSKRV